MICCPNLLELTNNGGNKWTFILVICVQNASKLHIIAMVES